jgi:uncharacterized protein (TIGR04168 family)
MTRLAVLGDIHGHWTDADAAMLDGLGYDAVLVVGDLAGLRFSGTLKVARGLSGLRTPALVLPGNHDATHPMQLLAHVAGRPHLGDPLRPVQSRRLEALHEALKPCIVAAYSRHRVGTLTVIAARPHSMGGPDLAFPAMLDSYWGIGSLVASAARLCELVDGVDTEDVIFLAHNGPTGLGDHATSIWGCDFRAEMGDWGDEDLARAVAHAGRRGHRVRAVVAGHMHRRARGGASRTWLVEHDDTAYVNAAEVPRIRRGRHHHVSVTVEPERVLVEDRWETA